jgi:hypothetical protein
MLADVKSKTTQGPDVVLSSHSKLAWIAAEQRLGLWYLVGDHKLSSMVPPIYCWFGGE